MSAILDYFTSNPWAIKEHYLTRLGEVIDRHLSGAKIDTGELTEIVARRDAKYGSRVQGLEIHGSTAVIPISGVIAPHSSQVNGSSQPRGTSIEQVRGALAAAMANDSVERIVLDIDSPGGSVAGVINMADQIRVANETKPVVAYAGELVASAAYWLASQASRVYATNGSEIGSIGVYLPVMDDSRKSENEGRVMQVFRSGTHKGAGMPGTRLSDEQKRQLQAEVDSLAERFKSAVSDGRGIDMESLEEIADGRTFTGSEAVEFGLADELLPKGTDLAQFLGILNGTTTSKPGHATAEAATRTPVSTHTGKDSAVTGSPNTEPTPDEIREQATKAGFQQGIEAERKRIAYIHSKAMTGQDELVERLVNEGASEHQALEQLHEDGRKRQASMLKEMQEQGSKPVGSLTEEPKSVKEDPERVAADAKAKASAGKPRTAREAWDAMSAEQQADEFDFETFKESWDADHGEGGDL